MGETENNKSTITDRRLRTDSRLSHLGVLNAFYWYQIFAQDSAGFEAQKC